ncbi:MAG: hypothetical protein ACK4MF_03135, partial [Hyphomicrobiaceae bacterium]
RTQLNRVASRSLERPAWPGLSLPKVELRLVLAALFGIGILHILATLMAPNLAIATAFDRLKPLLAINRMVVMPEIAPGAQPLPFLNPALRYAMCRFDTSVKPIDVLANFNDRGSSLNIYSPLGETIYAYAASSELRRQRVRLVAPDDRFMGLTPEARGQVATDMPTATLPILTGIAVIAIPDRGLAYRSETERLLQSARCTPAP